MASRLFNPHENSDFNGTPADGTPVGNNDYTRPLVGQTIFQYNAHNRMVGPTEYTHPGGSVTPGMPQKGQVKSTGMRGQQIVVTAPKNIDPAAQKESFAPYGSTI